MKDIIKKAEEEIHMINTIFFDVGNTLRIVIPDAEFSGAAEAELMRLVETTEPKEVFFEKLEANWKKYRKYAKTPCNFPRGAYNRKQNR